MHFDYEAFTRFATVKYSNLQWRQYVYISISSFDCAWGSIFMR